jgi:phage portal protein BeeE
MTVNPVDAQLIEQLKWTAETVCSCFHIQPYMISIGPPPPYANIEPLNIQYYSQCLQSLIENFELVLDEGLELPKPYGTEFDLSDLLRMDSATKTTVLASQISAGLLKPNEGRKALGHTPVAGGDTPYMQQQMYSLAALAKRDADDPFSKPVAALPPAPAKAEDEDDEADDEQRAASLSQMLRKELELVA